MEPVRWGILSTARINHAVLEPARETDKAEVVAVASRDQSRADDYAREQGIERAYGSYEALLADADVEAVYNSLPNSMHAEWSVRALEAGKHVLAEKPFSRKPAEAEHAFDVAERNGRLLMEGFMYRHHAQTRKL
jgi:D-xylose 1-dehydrogenase (NADP+, D-xylono-1,5-lactone-forming)